MSFITESRAANNEHDISLQTSTSAKEFGIDNLHPQLNPPQNEKGLYHVSRVGQLIALILVLFNVALIIYIFIRLA